MFSFELSKSASLIIQQGDITKIEVDAIVNAANPIMLGGGGVDGAIHRAAGPKLKEACRLVPKINGIRCPIGEARITPGFRLPSAWVIHTVGPRYRIDDSPEKLLQTSYLASLSIAVENGIQSIAFPAISCGSYGYPLEEAAEISIQACKDGCASLKELRFVLFGRTTFQVWLDTAREVL